VEDNWKMFAGHLKPIQNRQAEPSKLTSVKVKRICMKKQRLYRKAKKSGSLEHRAEFKKLHNETRDTLTAAHWSYVNGILLEFLERGYTKRPQTYLQRPSSWGRATAGRQDVVSHVHTAKRKVYSLHSSSRQM